MKKTGNVSSKRFTPTKGIAILLVVIACAIFLPPGAKADPVVALQTANGHFVTANEGGGIRCPYGLRTNARVIQGREIFTIHWVGDRRIALETPEGTFVTAVNGGGMSGRSGGSAVRTDATSIGDWEWFTLVHVNDRTHVALRTADGRFVSSVRGFRDPDNAFPIHTDATSIGPWEVFRLHYRPGGGAIVPRTTTTTGPGPY